MTDDPDDGGDNGSNSDGPRRRRDSGGNSAENALALFWLLRFAWNHPKLTVATLVIGGCFYIASSDDTSGPPEVADGPAVVDDQTPGRATGATLDPKVYDEALVYEPLAEGGPNQLPEKVSLLKYAPRRGDQGHQGSCVGWASSYAAATILLARASGQPPDTVVQSPSFLYNQIALRGCNGTYLVRAMEVLERTGDLALSEFPYTDQNCSHKPSGAQLKDAAEHRVRGFTRLSVDTDNYKTNALALMQHLATGGPVVIGMDVGGSFMSRMEGKRVWHPTDSDRQRRGSWGGHAMAVIGYDDTLEGGAFQLMNSWGTAWGEDGVAWVRYRDFDDFVKEAYGIYPYAQARASQGEQTIRFGLVESASHDRIALQHVEGAVYRTARPIKKGTRFKVEFSNTRPCFTYLLGQETDGSSYVLFPYTEKHSPYCGTTGTRVFPRKQSLTADDVGTRDYVAVVISPRPLDIKALNQQVSAQAGNSLTEKLQAVLGSRLSRKAAYSVDDNLVALTSAEKDDAKVHAMVLEFDKR
jgi:hypothetical protein